MKKSTPRLARHRLIVRHEVVALLSPPALGHVAGGVAGPASFRPPCGNVSQNQFDCPPT